MKNPNELRKLAAEKVTQAQAIFDAAKAENRTLAVAESDHMDGLLDESDKLKAEAVQVEADEKAAREKADAAAKRLAATYTASTASTRVIPPVAPSATVETSNIQTRERVFDDPTLGYGENGLGTFAQDTAIFDVEHRMTDRFRIVAAAGTGLEAGLDAYGGVMIPPAYSQSIFDASMASDSLLAETDQLPALPYGVESMEYPANAETSRADGSRHGGIAGAWKAELTQMSETRPKLKGKKFEPHQLYVLSYISDKLLKHGTQLEAYLRSKVADELNFKIGDAIINGTGGGQPRGVLAGATDAPRVQIAKESSQPATTLNVTNLEKMYARMPAKYMAGAKWYINQDVLPQLLALTKAVGTGGHAVFMPGGNIASAPFGTIYGRPIVVTEYNATLGTEGDVIFANMKQYATMGRGGVDSALSMHLKFDYAQTAFRFIFEIDGQPWHDSSLTPYKGTAKVSPFVTLATRA